MFTRALDGYGDAGRRGSKEFIKVHVAETCMPIAVHEMSRRSCTTQSPDDQIVILAA